MKTQKFSTPILLLAFNRPDYLRIQIQALQDLHATSVFVACDGPRENNEHDKSACTEIREYLQEVHKVLPLITLIREGNAGCKYSVSSAIDWFFTHVEEGIILEDDCLATPSFFTFASVLLAKYKINKKIWHIAGSHFIETNDLKESYFFSKKPLCWGWATWKDRWKNFNAEMPDWPSHKTDIELNLKTITAKKYWCTIFEKMYKKQIDTWDYQWIYTIWKNYGICIIPKYNLVTNIGFDHRATHTKTSLSPWANLKTENLVFPLTHPTKIQVNEILDEQIQSNLDENIFKKLIKGIFKILFQSRQ